MSNLKKGFMEGILPTIACFFLMGLNILPFRLIKNSNTNYIKGMGEMIVAGEQTNPTYGRLIFGVVAIIWLIIGSIILSKAREKKQQITIPRFLLCYSLGVTCWQIFGEIMWHFSFNSEEGYVNFVRLESIQGLPVFIAFTAFLISAILQRKYNDELLYVLGGMWSNWFGHVLIIGTAPFVYPMDVDTWYPIIALIISIPVIIIGAIVMFRDNMGSKEISLRERLYAAILMFSGLGSLFYIFIMQER